MLWLRNTSALVAAYLFLTMAQRMGVRSEHIGDSTGQLPELSLS